MQKIKSYKPTILACYMGSFSQSIAISLTPVLFIPIKEQFGLSYAQFGTLVLINFLTQLIVDISFCKAVNAGNVAKLSSLSHFLIVSGLLLFAATPVIFSSNVYAGFIAATVLFSVGSGFLELLINPIIDAIPSEASDKALTMMHSFFAWGQVAVVIITTLLLFAGLSWQILFIGWSVLPLANGILFLIVRVPAKEMSSKSMRIRDIIKAPAFIIGFFAIALGGAAEVTMSQWASSFMQKGLELPKVMGDILGMCGFALMMAFGRTIYGLKGDRLNINRIVIFGSFAAAVCYLLAAVSPYTWLSIVGCVVAGISVSLLWPGSLVITARKLPLAGAAMFGLLSIGGDAGASFGPWLTGVATDFAIEHAPAMSSAMTTEQFGLRVGMLVAMIFPLLTMLFQILLQRCKGGQDSDSVNPEDTPV